MPQLISKFYLRLQEGFNLEVVPLTISVERDSLGTWAEGNYTHYTSACERAVQKLTVHTPPRHKTDSMHQCTRPENLVQNVFAAFYYQKCMT